VDMNDPHLFCLYRNLSKSYANNFRKILLGHNRLNFMD